MPVVIINNKRIVLNRKELVNMNYYIVKENEKWHRLCLKTKKLII